MLSLLKIDTCLPILLDWAITFYLFNFSIFPVNKGERCQTPRQERGECIGILQCSSLLSLIQQLPIPTETANFLRSSQCGTENAGPLVCCPVVRSTLGKQL